MNVKKGERESKFIVRGSRSALPDDGDNDS